MQKTLQTSKAERISYGLYFAGQNFYYMIVASFMTLFLLNKGLSEAMVAAILIIPKIWDAVNDPIFGVILDKCHFKNGRFIPWLKISWFALPISTFLIFSMPENISQTAKIVWAVIGYVLWDTSYTMCDAPIFALSTTMSDNVEERTKILSLGRLFATVACIVATLAIESLYMSTGWTYLTLGICLLSMLLMLPVLFLAKERSVGTAEKDPTLKEMFRALMGNKYLVAFLISYFVIASTMFVEILIPIFAQYVYGNTDVGTVLIGICMVPMIVVAAILPAVIKKIDKFKIYIFCLLLFVLTSVLQYLVDFNNVVVLYISMFLRAIGYGGYNVLIYMFIPDIVEYGHYITGQRQEGIFFSLQTFVTKLSAAVVSSFSLILLSAVGFSSSNVNAVGIVETSAAEGFWGVFTLVPAVGTLVGMVILIRYYKLRDKDVQEMSEKNHSQKEKN